ncbi:PREDICTED: rab-like protein 6 [Atta cephalotes]|uniref:Uncharacterized protein n=1 Tax=Atta cephalotes TaxID=12957 RepID=A0A158P327_ATTCE|nr:PREDICTED: rab-like protein 6 [Atta cephalotes]
MTTFKISQELAFTSAPKFASKSKDSISKPKESREGDIPEYEKSEIKPKEKTKDINSTLDKEEVPKKKVSTRRKSTKSTEGSEDQKPVSKPKKKKPKSADESKVYNYMLII